jgi:hypothetical protein
MPAENTDSSPNKRVDAFLKGPEPQPGPVDTLPNGHPALETLKKIAGALMYAIPHYGQYKVRQDAATAAQQVRQQAAMQHAILSDAMKHPEAFDSPEVAKAAKGLFGPMGDNFINVIGALAKRDQAHKTAFAKRFTEYQAQHPDDLDALAHTIHDSMQAGEDVPKEAMTALIAGHERQATAQRMTPELIRRHAGEAQATLDVNTDPGNVEATAAAGGGTPQGHRSPGPRGRQGCTRRGHPPDQARRGTRSALEGQVRELEEQGRRAATPGVDRTRGVSRGLRPHAEGHGLLTQEAVW